MSGSKAYFPLIGAGGIDSGASALAKIRAGASLIQLYSGLVFRGLGLVAEIKAGARRRARARRRGQPGGLYWRRRGVGDRRAMAGIALRGQTHWLSQDACCRSACAKAAAMAGAAGVSECTQTVAA